MCQIWGHAFHNARKSPIWPVSPIQNWTRVTRWTPKDPAAAQITGLQYGTKIRNTDEMRSECSPVEMCFNEQDKLSSERIWERSFTPTAWLEVRGVSVVFTFSHVGGSLWHSSAYWRLFVTYAIFSLKKCKKKKTWYLLNSIYVKHINVLDFDDKFDCIRYFSYGILGIIFNGASAQLFSAQEQWVIRPPGMSE